MLSEFNSLKSFLLVNQPRQISPDQNNRSVSKTGSDLKNKSSDKKALNEIKEEISLKSEL